MQGEERGEDGLFEHVRADAFAGTGVVAIALGGRAGVVAVVVAAPAGDEPGEKVVGERAGEAPGVAFAALGEEGVGLVNTGTLILAWPEPYGLGLALQLLVVEDSGCDPADAFGIGDRVDLDDLALGDGETHHGHGLSAHSDDHSGCSVHQRGAQVDDRAR